MRVVPRQTERYSFGGTYFSGDHETTFSSSLIDVVLDDPFDDQLALANQK